MLASAGVLALLILLLILLPLYPQYAAPSTATANDKVLDALKTKGQQDLSTVGVVGASGDHPGPDRPAHQPARC